MGTAKKIVAADRQADDLFGQSVAIDGDFVVVGARNEDEDQGGGATLSNAGSAYIFKQTGGVWAQQQKIVASDRDADDVFGVSVAVSGDYVIAGAYLEDHDASGGAASSAAGSAYIFKQTAGVWAQQQKIVATDRGAADFFGYSVSISGDFAIIGAYQEDQDASGGATANNAGSAYIFSRSGSVWTQQQKIVASDRAADDLFGYSVSISGDYAIVGAWNEAEDASGGATLADAGSAYIFKQTAGTWAQQQKIVAADRGATDYFGAAVAISGDYAFVGAWAEDEDAFGGSTTSGAGSTYMFKQTAGTWAQQQKIVATRWGTPAPNDFFGYSVAIDGDYAIVGAWAEDEDASGLNTLTSAGSAYIFKRNGATWALQQKIVAADRAALDQFGYSVAISGDYALVSAYFDDEDASGGATLNFAGSCYIFKQTAGVWSQQQKIVAADRAANDNFGFSVGISGDYAVIGAYNESEDASGAATLASAGSAYIFKQTAGVWSQQQKIVASDRAAGDLFGYSAAISGDFVIVGAFAEDEDAAGANTLSNPGSAYIFSQTAGVWSQQQKLVPADRFDQDQFGSSVAIDGDYAIVGAYNEDENASGTATLNAAGSAYIFKQTAGSWSQQQKIVAADRAADDYFGYNVDIDGDYAIVGAYAESEDTSGRATLAGAGSAYLFKQTAGTWAQQQKIVSTDRAANDAFGIAVGISGDYAISGAYTEDEDANGLNNISNAGSAYIFQYQPTWYLDADNDGYYVSTQVSTTSPGAGWTSTLPIGGSGDCDDSNPALFINCPPLNDNCSGAIALTVNSSCINATYSSLNATNSGLPTPTCGFYQGGDVWFSAVVPASGNVRVEVNGLSGYNAQYAIYTGACGSLTQYSCNQLDAEITISDAALALQTIYIRVYRYNNAAGGSFNICLWEPTVPVNNNCVSATTITVGSSCVLGTYSSLYATAQPTSVAPIPTCGFYNGGDVWFSMVMPASGRIRIERVNLTGNAQYALYSGTCGAFTQLFCAQLNDDYTYHNVSLAGQTVYLRVFGYNSEDGGTFQLCAWEPPYLPNDDCANATPLAVGTSCTPANQTNEYATSQPLSVAPNPSCGFYSGGDAWYTVVMPATGLLTINRTNLSGNIQFALYSGSCGAFTEVACAQLTNTMNVNNISLAGQTLYLRVWNFNSEEGGTFTFCAYDPTCMVTVTNVATTPSSCSIVSDASITITATCANCTGALQYSINNGTNYQASNVFSGINNGAYFVRVRDGGNISCNTNYGFVSVASVIYASTYYQDSDGDTYGNASVSLVSCGIVPVGYVTIAGDCNDADAAINPAASEICGNGIDEDCSGADLSCAVVNTWLGGSTDWNDPANWSLGSVPNDCADDVIIPTTPANGHNFPLLDIASFTVGELTIQDGASITLNDNQILYVCKNLNGGIVNVATVDGNSNTGLYLIGADPQQINYKLNVNLIRINNSSMGGIDVLGRLNVYLGLVMQDGDVNTIGGSITLKSTATTTAYLDNYTYFTAGTYSGNITVERYIANTADGYRDICAPVNTTVSDLADDMSISGQDAVQCWYSYSPYPNVQVYDEALSIVNGAYYEGWLSRTGLGNNMPAMQGFAIRTYAGAPYTIDLTGAPRSGSKSIDITNTPSATSSQDGWNFIGNPFPSPISWTNTNANNPGATTGSYYVFNTTGEYTGNWGSYNGVTGTNGADDFIGTMQGFFVKAVDALNYVEANNASRVASPYIPFFKTYAVQPNEIRLSLHDQTNSDEIVAYTDPSATWSEDLGKDAVKIPAGSTVYMSYKQLGKEYAINVIDEITETTELPLVLWAQDSGTYTFEATELNVDGYITYLKDAELNTLTDLTTTPA
jgi:hypothetical protein